MRSPAVSIITPTWQRHELLMDRCVPAVQAQAYGNVEHVIVSDGPDGDLALKLGALCGWNGWENVVYRELPEHDREPHWGSYARLAALDVSRGQYITYCDDDDALRPEHCALMAAALDADPEAGFAVSRMLSHHPTDPSRNTVIGWGPLAMGNVGTPMIMHRRKVLEYGTWGESSFVEDWDLVWKWLQAGVTYVNVNAETADVWPSAYGRTPRTESS